MIVKYSSLEIDVPAFYKKHGIDPENLSFLGKGYYGSAYSTGDGRVVKITTSKTEFEIAQQLIETPKENIVKIFDAVFASESPLNYRYIILKEELEQNEEDEYLFYEVQEMLNTQGVPLTYISHFDMEEFEDLNGEIGEKLTNFFQEISEVVWDVTPLVGDRADISADNLGRDKNGTLKLLDVDVRK